MKGAWLSTYNWPAPPKKSARVSMSGSPWARTIPMMAKFARAKPTIMARLWPIRSESSPIGTPSRSADSEGAAFTSPRKSRLWPASIMKRLKNRFQPLNNNPSRKRARMNSLAGRFRLRNCIPMEDRKDLMDCQPCPLDRSGYRRRCGYGAVAAPAPLPGQIYRPRRRIVVDLFINISCQATAPQDRWQVNGDR